MSVVWSTVACVSATAVLAQDDKKPPSDASPKTYSLSQADKSSEIKVAIVDRSTINQKLYSDMFGLRLWVDSAESVTRIQKQIANSAIASRLRGQVARKIMETGVEPDAIPVNGKAGKELGTKGMILLKKGEFTRTGEYYDSSGGGLTILKDGTAQVSRGDKYQVRVPAFHIDKYKVTNAEYCKFLNDGNAGYATPWNKVIAKGEKGENKGKFVLTDESLTKHPVVLVNWYQAKGYASWAGKQLPTEAQWEYAAGGKEGRKYPWGNEPPDETRADIPIKYRHTVPVDWFPKGATPEGVFQMTGNSAEWCADYYDNASYKKAPSDGLATNPKGARQAFQPNTWYKFRVMFKGWCKSNRSEYFTCTKRHSRPPLADASAGVSFRCVKPGCG